jgi:hypothetical protein
MTPRDMVRRLRRRQGAWPQDTVAAPLRPLSPRPTERSADVPVMPAARIIQAPPRPVPPGGGRRRLPGECAVCEDTHAAGVARRWCPFHGWHTWRAHG